VCTACLVVIVSSFSGHGKILAVKVVATYFNPADVPCWTTWQIWCILTGNPNWRGRISTVNLLVLTSLDLVLWILNDMFLSFTRPAILMRRSIVLSPHFSKGYLIKASIQVKLYLYRLRGLSLTRAYPMCYILWCSALRVGKCHI